MNKEVGLEINALLEKETILLSVEKYKLFHFGTSYKDEKNQLP